ncbi:hypothetical protein ABID42_001801 [Arcicella rosea]|uniref:hypothetical protein n=1 Tax=Arcicella rosea TaxID=502909 RepID=UPI00345D7B16
MKNRNTLIITFYLLMVLLWNCGKTKDVVILPYYEKTNMLKLEVDSILFPPEILVFPVRLKLTNNTNKKIAMSFKPDVNKEFNKSLMFISTNNDTIRFKFTDSLLTFNEYSKTSFTVSGLYSLEQFEKGFKVLKRNFQNGKLIYTGNTYQKESIKISKQSSIDTLFIPFYLEASTKKTNFVDSFLQGSYFLVTDKIDKNK